MQNRVCIICNCFTKELFCQRSLGKCRLCWNKDVKSNHRIYQIFHIHYQNLHISRWQGSTLLGVPQLLWTDRKTYQGWILVQDLVPDSRDLWGNVQEMLLKNAWSQVTSGVSRALAHQAATGDKVVPHCGNWSVHTMWNPLTGDAKCAGAHRLAFQEGYNYLK